MDAHERAKCGTLEVVFLWGNLLWSLWNKDANQKHQTAKNFGYLELLYGDQTPVPVLTSNFFSCKQGLEETVQSFILRLHGLYCRLQQHDCSSDSVTGPGFASLYSLQPWRGVCWLASGGFAAVLHTTRGNVFSFINKQYGSPRTPSDADWRHYLKREIMDYVTFLLKGITQDIVAVLKPLLQRASTRLNPPNPIWTRAYPARPNNGCDEQGRPICHCCKKAGHVARYCRGAAKSEPALS